MLNQISDVLPLFSNDSRKSFLKEVDALVKNILMGWAVVSTSADDDFYNIVLETVQSALEEGEDRAYWIRFMALFQQFLKKDRIEQMKFGYPEVFKVLIEGTARTELIERMAKSKLKDLNLLKYEDHSDFESFMQTAYHSLLAVFKLYPEVLDIGISSKIANAIYKVAYQSNDILSTIMSFSHKNNEYPLLLNINSAKFMSKIDYKNSDLVSYMGACSRIGILLEEHPNSALTKNALSTISTPENKKIMIDLLEKFFLIGSSVV